MGTEIQRLVAPQVCPSGNCVGLQTPSLAVGLRVVAEKKMCIDENESERPRLKCSKIWVPVKSVKNSVDSREFDELLVFYWDSYLTHLLKQTDLVRIVDVRHTLIVARLVRKQYLGNDRRERFYKFTRPPLVVTVEHRGTGKNLTLALIHAKSKRPGDGLSKEQRALEAVENRKRIVAEGLRLRKLLFDKALEGAPYDRFIVMGDVNDGPTFDRYEKQIFHSGIEALLGSVLDPERILLSAIDLSNGIGEPSSSFAEGSIQLDHLVYTRNMQRGSQLPKIASGGRLADSV